MSAERGSDVATGEESAPAHTDSSAGGSSVSARARGTWDAFGRRFPRGPAMLLLVVLVLTLNGITQHRVSQVSRIDEHFWIDHLVRGSKFEIAQGGDELTDEAARELCRRGGDGLGRARTACADGEIDKSKLVWKGVNTAGHTPFYFFVSGPIARVLRATPIDLPPDDSLVSWARLLGSAWLLLGWYLVLRIGDLLGLHRRLLVTVLVFLSATPALLHASTIVNPDQTALPSGAAVLLAALAWEKRGKGMVWVALAALVGAALDPTNAIAVLGVALYFLFRWGAARWGEEGDEPARPWGEYLKLAAVMGVAVFLANRGWDRIYAEFIVHPPPAGLDLTKNPVARAYDLGGDGLGIWHLFGGDIIFSMFPPFRDIALPTQRIHPLNELATLVAEMLAIGALVAVVLRDRVVGRLGAIGFAAVASLLASPTLLVLYNYAVGGTFDHPIWRYGLVLLPFVAVVLVHALRTRFARWVFTAATAFLYVSALFLVLR